ncbi:MAG: GNAT family N-acetyltransferase [Clostridium sp.]|nr:GNAT family N-acetyltransferase [Clostridium sp.]
MLRPLTLSDYESLYALWARTDGFALRSVDDSKEGIARFLERNPSLSVAAVIEDEIIGAILCGHDGRQGCLYHVCVDSAHRRSGVGKAMVAYCVEALRREKISKVKLIAFTKNTSGNAFWQKLWWTKRTDLHYYDLQLNPNNESRIVKGVETHEHVH